MAALFFVASRGDIARPRQPGITTGWRHPSAYEQRRDLNGLLPGHVTADAHAIFQ